MVDRWTYRRIVNDFDEEWQQLTRSTHKERRASLREGIAEAVEALDQQRSIVFRLAEATPTLTQHDLFVIHDPVEDTATIETPSDPRQLVTALHGIDALVLALQNSKRENRIKAHRNQGTIYPPDYPTIQFAQRSTMARMIPLLENPLVAQLPLPQNPEQTSIVIVSRNTRHHVSSLEVAVGYYNALIREETTKPRGEWLRDHRWRHTMIVRQSRHDHLQQTHPGPPNNRTVWYGVIPHSEVKIGYELQDLERLDPLSESHPISPTSLLNMTPISAVINGRQVSFQQLVV